MNKLPEFYVEVSQELKIVWRYSGHGSSLIWLYRLGDGFVRKLTHEVFLASFEPVRGSKTLAVLERIAAAEETLAQPHIYDLYREEEESGVWTKLYRTQLHRSPVQRTSIILQEEARR